MHSFFNNIFTSSFIQTKPTEIDLNYTIPVTDMIVKKVLKEHVHKQNFYIVYVKGNYKITGKLKEHFSPYWTIHSLTG